MIQRLEAKSVSAKLAMELVEAWRNLQVESDEHDLMNTTLRVVYDDLEVVRLEGTSSLVAHAIDIMAWVCQLERDALRAGVTQAFAIAHSLYADSIDLETMSLGFAPGYEASKLDEIETAVAPLVQDLVNRVEDIVLPQRG